MPMVLFFFFPLDTTEFYSYIFRVLVPSIAPGKAERTSENPPLKANMRQRLTRWSAVDEVISG